MQATRARRSGPCEGVGVGVGQERGESACVQAANCEDSAFDPYRREVPPSTPPEERGQGACKGPISCKGGWRNYPAKVVMNYRKERGGWEEGPEYHMCK